MVLTRLGFILACGLATLYFVGSLTNTTRPPRMMGSDPVPGRQSRVEVPVRPPAVKSVLEVSGKTQPAPGRFGQIAPTVLHPVTHVLVRPGDSVQAGQVLVRLDSDEPEADVRAKRAELAELEAGLARLKALPREEERAEARAALEATRAALELARQCHDRFEGLRQRDAISLHQHQEAHSTLRKAEAEERAAEAHLQYLIKQPVAQEIAEMEARVAAARAILDAAEAELEHYSITAPIDGVVTRLEVCPGTVSRPGTSVWGEIIDLSEVDIRCDLTAAEADRVTLGQEADIIVPGRATGSRKGRVVFEGVAADPATGRVPVVVRVANAEDPLRCHVDVTVQFRPGSPEVAQGQDVAAPPPSADLRVLAAQGSTR